jgi:hypothetical protein
LKMNSRPKEVPVLNLKFLQAETDQKTLQPSLRFVEKLSPAKKVVELTIPSRDKTGSPIQALTNQNSDKPKVTRV